MQGRDREGKASTCRNREICAASGTGRDTATQFAPPATKLVRDPEKARPPQGVTGRQEKEKRKCAKIIKDACKTDTPQKVKGAKKRSFYASGRKRRVGRRVRRIRLPHNNT